MNREDKAARKIFVFSLRKEVFKYHLDELRLQTVEVLSHILPGSKTESNMVALKI